MPRHHCRELPAVPNKGPHDESPFIEPYELWPCHKAAIALGEPQGMFKRKRKLGSRAGFEKRPQDVAAQRIDIQVDIPEDGCVQLTSRYLFHDLSSVQCSEFLERLSHAPEIDTITMTSKGTQAKLYYCPNTYSYHQAMQSIAQSMRGKPTASVHTPNGSQSGDVSQTVATHHLRPDANEVIRLYRYGTTLSAWQVKHEIPGRLRLKHPALHRKKIVCQAIERELMNALGIESYKVNVLTSTVLVVYDADIVQKYQIIEIVDSALAHAEDPLYKDVPDLNFPLNTLCLPVAATAQWFVPSLIPVATVLFLLMSFPSVKGAYQVLRDERRLGVDVLDTLIVLGCLLIRAVFVGAFVNWCLSLGRLMVDRTRDNSKRMLLNVFGKQPRHVWLCRDGIEVETLLDNLQLHDIIVVHTGEVVPVDGTVTEGLATVDQHTLTGEATPAEKTVGDQVFASTVMLSGKLYVRVEKAGSQTTSAQVSHLLNDAAGYTLLSQSRGEILADRAVVPTLAMGGLAYATAGLAGAMAVVNSDFGTGIRMAAPLAMLTSLTLCAKNGILVKDGRALELMNNIDTILFDKTGTLTRERPEVGAVITCGDLYDEDDIIRYAAAAEHKFSHPIAKAIQHKAESTLR